MRLRWLGTERLTWRDLLVIVRQSQPGDRVFHVVHDDYPMRADVDLLSLSMLRSVEYSQRWLQWAQTVDGSKGRNLPEPERFPWETVPDKGGYRGDSMTFAEAMDWAGWSAEMSEHMGGGV